jgi:hypothetical protein
MCMTDSTPNPSEFQSDRSAAQSKKLLRPGAHGPSQLETVEVSRSRLCQGSRFQSCQKKHHQNLKSRVRGASRAQIQSIRQRNPCPSHPSKKSQKNFPKLCRALTPLSAQSIHSHNTSRVLPVPRTRGQGNLASVHRRYPSAAPQVPVPEGQEEISPGCNPG